MSFCLSQPNKRFKSLRNNHNENRTKFTGAVSLQGMSRVIDLSLELISSPKLNSSSLSLFASKNELTNEIFL